MLEGSPDEPMFSLNLSTELTRANKSLVHVGNVVSYGEQLGIDLSFQIT